MNIRELPRRAGGLPIVKATYLGWLSHYTPGMPGYFCVAMTHDRSASDASKNFRVHVMWAAGLDKPWKEHETRTDLSNGEASALFAEYEKLAEWPEEGSK